MNFVNNWIRGILLTSGATSCPLDLPDGTYRLALADAMGAEATRWEYIDAVVASGVATLTRGREGTTAQGWGAGSVIYCPPTAGVLEQLFSQIADLQLRVSALESGVPVNAVRVTAGLLTSGDGYNVGWSAPVMGDTYGELLPQTLNVPGRGAVPVVQAMILQLVSSAELYIAFAGADVEALIESVNVQGVGVLAFADGDFFYDSDLDVTVGYWPIDTHDWEEGAERLLTFTFV